MTPARFVKPGILLFGTASLLFSAEFSARVVDNIGKPVIGARVVGECHEFRPNGKYRRTQHLFTVKTDANGIFHGTYKEPKPGCEKSAQLNVDMEGYASAAYGGLHSLYVLKRTVHAADLHQVVRLSGADLNVALRNLLTGDVGFEYWELQELVFYYEDRLRPALRSLMEDPEAGDAAQSLLAFIGVPEDLQSILQSGAAKDQKSFEHYALVALTCSLLQPASEMEWSLLREGALDQYKDYGVVRGAIQSLKLIASPRSRQILEEVRRSNSFGAELAPSALEYIQSNPQPLRDQQLEELGHRVAQALGSRTWTGNGTPRYNQAGDKALIALNFDAGEDRYIFTGTFQRVDGTWVLRGVRETRQTLVIIAASGKAK